MIRFPERLGFCLILTLFVFGEAGAAELRPEVKQLVGVFEARYRAAHTLQVTFLERYSENGRIVRVEAGTAYFRRPGKMRWEYQAPEKNLFLVDGKTAWFYVPSDHTVTRVPAKDSTDWRTPLALLTGEMKISRVCDRIGPALDEKPESTADVVLYCKIRGARSEPQKHGSQAATEQSGDGGEAVYFEISKKSGELVRVLVRDPGGVGIEFHFSHWQTDPPVEDSLFRFSPSPGVAIVNGEIPAAHAGVTQ